MSDESKNPALPELAAMQYVGDGSQMAGQIADLVGKTVLFHDLDRNDLALLAGFMKLYKVEQGNAVLQEGVYGDIMLLLIDREPRLGAKVLVQLLELVGQRLRQTGGILVNYLKID